MYARPSLQPALAHAAGSKTDEQSALISKLQEGSRVHAQALAEREQTAQVQAELVKQIKNTNADLQAQNAQMYKDLGDQNGKLVRVPCAAIVRSLSAV